LANSVNGKHDDQEKEERYKTLKATIGTVAILFSSLSAMSLARLLYIHKDDIDQRLHSIPEVPKDQACTILHFATSSTNEDAVINTSGGTRRRLIRL
jgi:hypothetical protein